MGTHSSTLTCRTPWMRSLVSYSPWVSELNMTEWLSTYRDEGLAQSSVVTSVRSEEKQPMGSLKSNSGSQGQIPE